MCNYKSIHKSKHLCCIVFFKSNILACSFYYTKGKKNQCASCLQYGWDFTKKYSMCFFGVNCPFNVAKHNDYCIKHQVLVHWMVWAPFMSQQEGEMSEYRWTAGSQHLCETEQKHLVKVLNVHIIQQTRGQVSPRLVVDWPWTRRGCLSKNIHIYLTLLAFICDI